MPQPGGVLLDLAGLQAMFDALHADGWTVVAPTVRGDAVVPAEVTSVEELPHGWGDEQAPGHYRLRRRDDAAVFGYAGTAVSWKSWLFPSRQPLWRARRDADGTTTVAAAEGDTRPLALVGVRSCDLRALQVHDRVLTQRGVVDEDYAQRRGRTFVVAVTCGSPADTCFCASLGNGPRPTGGYDVALTELVGPGRHDLLAVAGTDRGSQLLAGLPQREAGPADREAADAVVDTGVRQMHRQVDPEGVRDDLYAATGHPRWEEVARRCLACGNCTLACPTCFCTTVETSSDVSGDEVEHARVWDSCFSAEFTYLHGGSVRGSTSSRYRQWLTHKFAAWSDQFGELGCVGCGRCITFCPVGIDITEEVAALRPPREGDHAQHR